jgi:acyl-coenzyme A thioesterase PaaI-like protein
MDCQFRGANDKGQTVTARGRITSVSAAGEQMLVELDVWTESEGRPLAVGHATVAVPSDGR